VARFREGRDAAAVRRDFGERQAIGAPAGELCPRQTAAAAHDSRDSFGAKSSGREHKLTTRCVKGRSKRRQRGTLPHENRDTTATQNPVREEHGNERSGALREKAVRKIAMQELSLLCGGGGVTRERNHEHADGRALSGRESTHNRKEIEGAAARDENPSERGFGKLVVAAQDRTSGETKRINPSVTRGRIRAAAAQESASPSR
jgi:hypothetical protein